MENCCLFEDRPPATAEYLLIVRQLRNALIYSLATCDPAVSTRYLQLRERLLAATNEEERRVVTELRQAGPWPLHSQMPALPLLEDGD